MMMRDPDSTALASNQSTVFRRPSSIGTFVVTTRSLVNHAQIPPQHPRRIDTRSEIAAIGKQPIYNSGADESSAGA
jgi:hypothetical protein